MKYTDKVIEHFMNPRNIGEIPNADAVGTIGSEECGDMIRVWIKVSNEHLVDIKYKVFGCPAAIACCSMMTELAIGKHVDDAWDLTDDQVAEALGGLPEYKDHCSNLAASTLHKTIMNYIFKSLVKTETLYIRILVDNTPLNNFKSEHGLSLWIKYGDKRVLFDTGQTNLLLQNAKKSGIDLPNTDAVVLSHGHYDHTGCLPAVLNIASHAKIYLHPAATEQKFSQNNLSVKYIGMSELAKKSIQGLDVTWTATPAYLFPGLAVTGQIARTNDFEDVGGAFFVNDNCQKSDNLLDDQALFIESDKGLIVVLGCAHSGVVNTLDHISILTGQNKIYAVIGGMHLLNASQKRINNTIETFKKYQIQKVIPLHCTGQKAVNAIKNAFGDKCLSLGTGAQVSFQQALRWNMPYRKLNLFVSSQISYYVMAKSDTNEFGRLIASSIGIAVPKNRNNWGYISEVYGFGMNWREFADIAADLAADMLGKILGFEVDPNQTQSGKEQVYKTSGLIIRISNITQTTKGQENLWITTVAIAMFSLD